ncbi:MAG: alternative ribosome rescue aminoacyl-tRNA hydrolase ArfB [Desulfobacterales bacterium]|jgi:ribosome-associated protein
MIHITPEIKISEKEIKLDFIHAAGPGGQNVNKVATAVQLRFDVKNAPLLPDNVRKRLIRLAGRRITEDGILVIQAKRFRSQERNRQDARQRLVKLIRMACEQPKTRRKTKPTRASKERLLAAKRHRGQIKRLRKPVSKTNQQ